jgi:hypothetical protein
LMCFRQMSQATAAVREIAFQIHSNRGNRKDHRMLFSITRGPEIHSTR